MNKITSCVIGILLLAGTVLAGPKGDNQKWYAADASPAVWVKNTFSESVSCVVTGDSGTITIVVGTHTNTIDASGTSVDTVTELESAILAVTNSAGKTGFDIFRCAAAGLETIDDELLVTTTTLSAGSAGGIVLWDTSDTKHYRAYIPPSGGGASRSQLLIESVYGNVKGTGVISMKSYTIRNNAASDVDYKEIVSPAYVPSVTNVTNTADEVGPGSLDMGLDLIVGKDHGFLLSADRATTATTGGIGLRTREP